MNPWHDVSYKADDKDGYHCVVEISKNSKVKYEIDKVTGLLMVDRILYSSVHYPSNYGYIPQTLAGDGDALDVLVLSQEIFHPLSVCRFRPLGVLVLMDQGEEDDKIIAVHLDDPEYSQYQNLDELPKHRILEIQNFFEQYKKLENKNMEFKKLGRQDLAIELIDQAVKNYDKEWR